MRINVCSLTKQNILNLSHTEIYKKKDDKNTQLKNPSSGSKFNTHKTTRHVLKKVTLGVGIGVSALI